MQLAQCRVYNKNGPSEFEQPVLDENKKVKNRMKTRATRKANF